MVGSNLQRYGDGRTPAEAAILQGQIKMQKAGISPWLRVGSSSNFQ